MKKKGFTLVELLAVIVVLAVISIIAIPVITGVIDNARKGSFKASVLGLMEAGDLYRATNTVEYDENDQVIFYCEDGKCVNDKDQELSVKGEGPDGGQLIINKDGKIEAYYIEGGAYCAFGERTDLKIEKDCFSMDDTAPELEVTFIKATTNEIIVNIKATDLESGINKIIYEIDGKIIEDRYKGERNLEINKVFDKLLNEQTYSIKVTVENRNDMSVEKTIEGSTNKINSPGVNIDAQKVGENGYYINQIASLTYDNTNIENPEYFVRTTRKGISNIKITESCGEGALPTQCEKIEETTTLEADKWYKVSGDLNISYSELATEEGTIYATIYDGSNYITTTGVILKTTVEVDYQLNHSLMNLDGLTYTLKETETLKGYAFANATPDTKTYEGFTSPEKANVYVLLDGSSVMEYKYSRNQYTVTVNAGTGIASTTGSGNYYYEQEVTVGYVLSTGYHFLNWSGDYTNPTFKMSTSNVTIQANGEANTYTVAYLPNTGSGSMTSITCTYDSNCKLTANAFTKSSYTFNGWRGSNGGAYTNGQTVKNLTAQNGGTVTLYAKWKGSNLLTFYKQYYYIDSSGSEKTDYNSMWSIFKATVPAGTYHIQGSTGSAPRAKIGSSLVSNPNQAYTFTASTTIYMSVVDDWAPTSLTAAGYTSGGNGPYLVQNLIN